MGLIAAIVGGAALSAGATAYGASEAAGAADDRQQQLAAAANTPGIDLASIYKEAYDSNGTYFDKAGNQVRKVNAFNADSANQMLEQSLPGFGVAQRARLKAAGSLLQGELPDDVMSQVRRTSAGKAIAGGYAGSQAGRNLEARDLGLTSLDLIGKGNSLFSNIIGSTPMARATDINEQLFSPKDILGLRSGERTSRMNAMAGAASAPTSGEVWGKGIAGIGSSLGSALLTYGIAAKAAQAAGGGFGGGTPTANWSGVTVGPGYVTPLP